jgi:hypothetical protein
MAGGAIFRGGRMSRAVSPILGHLAVTTETQGRLALLLVAGMRRTMAAVAGDTLQFSRRLMLEPVSANFGLDLRMAVEAYFSRLAFDEISLIRSMRAVAVETIALGKRRMGGFFQLFPDQIIMTG